MIGNNASLLYGILMASGTKSAAQLAQRTGLSQPVISRALNELAEHTGRLIVHREGRGVVYAISRQIRSLPTNIPIHRVSANSAGAMGRASLMGTLTSLEGGGYLFQTPGGNAELFDGLPWFLQDMRPQGYIGRSFCQAYADELGLSGRLPEWTDDDVIYALSAFGEDSPGNLVIGNAALRRFLLSRQGIRFSVSEGINIAGYYDALADEAVHGGAPGSSAAGEHPKFLARYSTSDDDVHNVIVKFSPLLDGAPAATRWKDLLIAEHVASETLRSAGIDVPDTRIVLSERRCFLESHRYDRSGLKGRSGTVSFEAVDNAFVGSRRSWSASAAVLRSQGMIGADTEERIRLIESFGRAIGNTDMHFGNLSFYWSMHGTKVNLMLAPVYDMLPMLYAPEKSEVVDRLFNPREEAGASLDLAIRFWTDLASHTHLSESFKCLADANATCLKERTDLGESPTAKP